MNNKKKAFINVGFAVMTRGIILVVMILARRLLIKYLGMEIAGVYSLLISIVGVLSVAESGIGTAIVFSMYKSINDKNENEVIGLYNLFKKAYVIIAIVIFTVGLLITPFLPKIVSIQNFKSEIYISYVVLLLSTVITYFYAAKTSLFIAHRDDYITSVIYALGQIIQGLIQIMCLVFFKSFTLFVLAIGVGNIVQLLISNYIFNSKYENFSNNHGMISADIKHEVKRNVLSMFAHKIGGVLVSTSNNIIISVLISVTVLANYTNYTTVLNAVLSLILVLFTSITSVVGHVYVSNNKEQFLKVFKRIYIINYIIAFVFFMGYFAIIDDLVTILFSSGASLSNSVILTLSISSFIQFMRQTTLLTRDATGTFYYDRFKPILEGIVNIILTVILIIHFGIIGVIIALIVTNLLITHVIEPFVLYKYAFKMKPTSYYVKNYLLMLYFIIMIVAFNLIVGDFSSNLFLNIFYKGTISVIFSSVSILFLSLISIEFRKVLFEIIKEVLSFLKFKKK